jgi:hypothetical protein
MLRFKIKLFYNSSLHYTFRATRPSAGALKFVGNCWTFRATAIRVFVFAVFLNEVNLVPSSMPHVFSLDCVMIYCVSAFISRDIFKLYIVSAVKFVLIL